MYVQEVNLLSSVTDTPSHADRHQLLYMLHIAHYCKCLLLIICRKGFRKCYIINRKIATSIFLLNWKQSKDLFSEEKCVRLDVNWS